MKLSNKHHLFPSRCCRQGQGKSTASQEPPKASGGMTDAEANKILQQMRVGDLRSTFAQALFPYDRLKYGTRGQWAKAVGIFVSKEIHEHPQLRLDMQKAGYVGGAKGYTQEQKIILIKHFKSCK